MYWDIPKIWEGGECWIIGGGPSIPYEFGVPEEIITRVQNGELSPDAYSPYLSPIHDKHVIAVNAAFLLGSWVDFIFFGDGGFYWKNRAALLAFPKHKISCNGTKKDKDYKAAVKPLLRDGNHPFGISLRKRCLSWNQNSGGCAINLAVQMGAKKIYLLGFDMDVDSEKNQHFHRQYSAPGVVKDPKKYPFDRHLKAFSMIAKDAKRLGIEIINVSQMSVIKEFPKMTVKEIFQ